MTNITFKKVALAVAISFSLVGNTMAVESKPLMEDHWVIELQKKNQDSASLHTAQLSIEDLQLRESYLREYGFDSDFWKKADSKVKRKRLPTLKSYILELAQHYRGEGKALKRQLEDLNTKKYPGKAQKMEEDVAILLDHSAELYLLYRKAFPEAEDLNLVTYIHAETLFDARNYAEAISTYDEAIKQNSKYSVEAAYAKVLCYQLLNKEAIKDYEQGNSTLANMQNSGGWFEQSIDTKLEFAEQFRRDPRAKAVAISAGEELYQISKFKKAVDVLTPLATAYIKQQKTLDPSDRYPLKPKMAGNMLGILADSHFQLKEYPSAEQYYLLQRNTLEPKSEAYSEVTERLAESIYEQAKIAQQNKDAEARAKHLLRIKALAPNSAIRVVTQLDAAKQLMDLGQWQAAINELNSLKQAYPKHKLYKEFIAALAIAYEKSEQWPEAADSQLTLYEVSKEPQKREALLKSAFLYKKATQFDKAIEYFKRYAYDYEQPFSDRMEARYQLAIIYNKVGEIGNGLYWLRRIVDADAEAGEQRTPRSKWLAAWANAEYGDFFLSEFDAVNNGNLKAKQEKFNDALERYKAAAEYGITEFASKSDYKIAELNEKFSNALKAVSNRDKEKQVSYHNQALYYHQANIDRSWQGEYNTWVEQSYAAMARLRPERFNKHEIAAKYGEGIR